MTTNEACANRPFRVHLRKRNSGAEGDKAAYRENEVFERRLDELDVLPKDALQVTAALLNVAKNCVD